MKCPKCHRDTYSAKWGTCTSCNSVTPKAPSCDPVTAALVSAEPVMPSQGRDTVTEIYGAAGHCPTCTCVERKVYATNAARQKAYRERHGN